MKRIYLPLTKDVIKKLKVGDEVELWGTLYTARDKAHQRLYDAIKKKKELPIPLNNQVIYYTGPTPAPPGRVIGSCGPTTSSRMDPFTPLLLKNGVKGLIGKGERSIEVVEAIRRYGCLYFIVIGGIGTLLAQKVYKAEVLAYKDLGPEAIYMLQVRGFPAIVGIDSRGNDIFKRRSRR